MDQKEIRYLLEQYLSQKATEEEHRRLFELLEKGNKTTEWEKAIRQIMEQHPADPDYSVSRWDPLVMRILQQDRERKEDKKNKKKSYRIVLWRTAAAVCILFLGIGFWSLIKQQHVKLSVATTELKPLKGDIHPGGNKAILTLANGQNIILDSMHNGTIAIQGNSKILKLKNGQLAYDRTQKNAVEEIFNTLKTPRGGQYKVTLPDGSKVWLNAASSIRFPATFSGKYRHVFVKGEAYFEIAENELKPFIVSVNEIEVKVLGTHFNIMAYQDEPVIETTLLEGAVEVTNGNAVERLKPGQQANVNQKGKIELIEHANTREAVAWKEGLFQFSDDDIGFVMRQIARWYDVEVVYTNGVPIGHITGKIPRNTELSNVLKIMQLSGIHFKVEGRKVIVLTS